MLAFGCDVYWLFIGWTSAPIKTKGARARKMVATNPLPRLAQTRAAVKHSIVRDINFIASSSTPRNEFQELPYAKAVGVPS